MKILYFSEQYGPHDHRFLSAIIDAGHEAFFLRLNDLEKESRPFPTGTHIVRGTIRQAIAGVKPDLVHAGPLTTCGYLAVKTDFHPLVQMSWGSDILYAARRSREARRRVRAALQKADVLVADCAAVGDAAVKLGFSRTKIVTFPWGVDLKQFNPRGGDAGLRKKLGWQKNLIFLHVRGWEPLYDPETALRSFALAAAEQPSLRLLMPGNGSMKARLQIIVNKSGLADYVFFPGSIVQKDLSNYYRAADLYISASKSDGSSVSLLEALASGLPALASDIPGNREWIREGEEGWLFRVGNEKKLAGKILAAIENPKQLQRMAKRARAVAVKKANWSKNKKLLLQAYKLAMDATA